MSNYGECKNVLVKTPEARSTALIFCHCSNSSPAKASMAPNSSSDKCGDDNVEEMYDVDAVLDYTSQLDLIS